MLYRWRNAATNRAHKGCSRFRHIKNGGFGGLCVRLQALHFRWEWSVYASYGGMEAAAPLLAVTSQPAYCSVAFDLKTAAGCNKNPAYARHTLSDVKTNSYWRIFARNGRCTPIAAFCFQPRAPPLLKFWFSQNFKRTEETPCQGAEQKQRKSAIRNIISIAILPVSVKRTGGRC